MDIYPLFSPHSGCSCGSGTGDCCGYGKGCASGACDIYFFCLSDRFFSHSNSGKGGADGRGEKNGNGYG